MKGTGKSRGQLQDAAEKWLKANDPNYKRNRKNWQTPGHDALARFHSEENAVHPTLEDRHPIETLDVDWYPDSDRPMMAVDTFMLEGDKYVPGVVGDGSYHTRMRRLSDDDEDVTDDFNE